MAEIRNLGRRSTDLLTSTAGASPVRPTRACHLMAPRRRLLLEDGHAATTVLIVGVALLFLLVIVAPAIRALQSAVEVLP